MSKDSKSNPGTSQGSRADKLPPQGARHSVAQIPGKKKSATAKASPDHDPQRQKTGATDFIFYTNPILTLVCMPPDTPVLFSLEEAADFTGVHPDMLLYYWRTGLIEVCRGERETELFFDENALGEIRRIEHYRRHLGIGRRALPLICELQRESARQQITLHFLR